MAETLDPLLGLERIEKRLQAAQAGADARLKKHGLPVSNEGAPDALADIESLDGFRNADARDRDLILAARGALIAAREVRWGLESGDELRACWNMFYIGHNILLLENADHGLDMSQATREGGTATAAER